MRTRLQTSVWTRTAHWLSALGRQTKLVSLGALAVCSGVSCGDLPIANEVPPKGNIFGAVVYSGPMPCTRGGHVVGAAQMLLFNEILLPPPDGLGASAASLAVVSGDKLFASIQNSLPSSDDPDELVCPPSDAPHVTVSADFAIGPVNAGVYQLRGFYDYDGNFSPILRTQNLPTAGDVGGGSIANTTEALLGAKPIYNRIAIGEDPDGDGVYTMPQLGARVDNVTVTLAKRLTWARPIYYWKKVFEGTEEQEFSFDSEENYPTLAPDRLFPRAPKQNAPIASSLFFRVILGAGVPEEEKQTSLEPPFELQASEPWNKFVMYPGKDAEGEVEKIPEVVTESFVGKDLTTDDPDDEIEAPVDSTIVADLFPQAVFARLNTTLDPTRLSTSRNPAATISGLVVNKGLIQTNVGAINGELEANGVFDGYDKRLVRDELEVFVRPSVACLNPLDPDTEIFLVTPSFTNVDNTEQIIFPEDLRKKLAKRFKQYTNGDLSRIHIVEGCLPKGSYALNIVYDTGQSWTGPNEAGICQAPLESLTADGDHCIQQGQEERPLLHSQGQFLTVGDPAESDFCASVHTRNRGDKTYIDHKDGGIEKPIQFLHGVPTVCLRAEEIDLEKDQVVQ